MNDGVPLNFSIQHKNDPFVQITVMFSVCNEMTTERQCQSVAENETCEDNYCIGNSDTDIILIFLKLSSQTLWVMYYSGGSKGWGF